MVDKAAESGDETVIAGWLEERGIPADWLETRHVLPAFEPWWAECEKAIQERREAQAAEQLKRSSSPMVSEHTSSSPMPPVSTADVPADAPAPRMTEQTTMDARIAAKRRRRNAPRRPTVFIVHGHDVTTLAYVESLLLRIGCQPVTFRNYPEGSKTNIEILEYSIPKADAVVALLTPDDEGRKLGDENLLPRSRQNVLVEAGYAVISRRESSIIVAIGGVEIPSDFDGINRVQGDRWNREMGLDLARRLEKHFNLKVDLHAI
jgi:predicted nucleotide-binding protein